MEKTAELVCQNRLDMVNAQICDNTLDDLVKVAEYLHSPEIDEELVLGYANSDGFDNKCQTIFIYRSGTLVRTARSLEHLFDDYGLMNEIEDWLSFQRTMAYLIKGAVKLAPYTTIHSAFLKVNSDSLLNLNYISGYQRSKLPEQRDTYTDVILSTGMTVEVPLGYKSFQKRYHEGGLILIALRKLFRFTYTKDKTHSIYAEPTIINPFLLKDLKENNMKEISIAMSDFKKVYYFYETLEKQLKDVDMTEELLRLYDPLTQKILIDELVNKNKEQGCFKW